MRYYWHGNSLMQEIKSIVEVQKLKMATAYFSAYGLKNLKEIISNNKLSKEDIELYLSPLFSYQNPSELLDEARQIATVYIVEPIPFHSKVYWFKHIDGKEKVIFGSSNFTQGGLERNIEFDMIRDVEHANESEQFKIFFDFCRNNAKVIDQNTINTYKKNEEELTELHKIESKMKQKMLAHSQIDDPFSKDDYSIEDFYFNYEDYELFFLRNQKRKDTNIKIKREQVREKLMKLHDDIYKSKIKSSLGLHCHKRKDNICSSTTPSVINDNHVTWLGIRYGKTSKEVDYLNIGAGKKDDLYGFHKHACLQFSITQNGLEVNLFHAVAKGAVDRGHVHGMLLKTDKYKDEITNAIEQLKGEGFVWQIIDSTTKEWFEFSVDERPAIEFVSYYLKYDKEGRESFLTYVFEPYRLEIKTATTITSQIVDKMRKLLPLYNLMTLRIHEFSKSR